MNARASQLVSKIQTQLSALQTVRSQLWALQEEYTAKGGQTFIREHFLDAEGQPRTDLDITEAAVVTGMFAVSEVLGTLATHRDNIAGAAS